ncbi:MAG TPA: hypothetical protein VJ913_08760, partial [Actinomycetota bacterium]|nr:hypothetical protein [Actinomycetota bacterium]
MELVIGLVGLDLIDRFIEIGRDGLKVLFGRRAFRRKLCETLPFGLKLRSFAARRSLVLGREGKTLLVEFDLDAEDLFVGGSAVVGGGRLRLVGLRLRSFVALRMPFVGLLGASNASGRDGRQAEAQQRQDQS